MFSLSFGHSTLKLAFFSALAKIIAELGGPYVFRESYALVLVSHSILPMAFYMGKTTKYENDCIKCFHWQLHFENGKTAAFWLNYVHLMHSYHSFNGSVKSGDLNLCISCFPQRINCFFRDKSS